MVTFLLDTNVLSELRKGGRCDPHLKAWFDPVPEDDLFTSVLCLGEIRRGLEMVRSRDRMFASRLEIWLSYLIELFGPRALPVDLEVALRWGLRSPPRSHATVDGLLAATAVSRAMVVVTRNVRDFERADVEVLNPFEPLH